MPEGIFGWLETRSVTSPLSTYGSNTTQMRRMINLHPTEVEGMYAMWIATLCRGSSRRNDNEDREDAWCNMLNQTPVISSHGSIFNIRNIPYP